MSHPRPVFRFTRRDFLKTIGYVPNAFMATRFAELLPRGPFPLPSSSLHFQPKYPAKSPLDDVLRLAEPGFDEYITEKYASEIMQLLNRWSEALKRSAPAMHEVADFVAPTMRGGSLRPVQNQRLRSDALIEIVRLNFSPSAELGRDHFIDGLQTYLSTLKRVETAEFQIIDIDNSHVSGPIRVDIRYDLVGLLANNGREQRTGLWRTQWVQNDSGKWNAIGWQAAQETVSRVRERVFTDVTYAALGGTESYKKQLLHGADYWRTVLDGASGIDVYGNNGLAVGDIDNDGFDDLYICQPPGLPNRLYRNCGDGTFEDITDTSGVGLLDGTACALFADFENKGAQDLMVVCATGPQLFLNEGNGKFRRKPDAFKFAHAPQGTFTHAAAADYDSDGNLDIYFCLYSYYLGLDQYHYPAPYFDARNGPPNFLMHNDGHGNFSDQTEAAGLNAENDRYSFACAWGDLAGDGRASLYVANDFGRNNLYRNNGDGTFTAISDAAHVNDVGAGMSATWIDYDNDGQQDLYAANMWSAAGLRVSQQERFHDKDPEAVRELYRRHARGNSLYRNSGNGQFTNVSEEAGVEMGRWAWCSDAWDFDYDGHPDIYIANGYVSGADRRDVASFFWRQVVGKSPSSARPSPNYEHGWNAINELIRSDSSWSGYERNVLYLNHGDGTFSDVSGAFGLDFPDDSRSFVLSDLDHDGRLELILKNRNAPQLRILRCGVETIGHSIIFRLRGNPSNRDAIGAAVTVESAGKKQKRYLQAGSGFLAQHTKELVFGIGQTEGSIRATVRWPSGSMQTFEDLPVDHRIALEEGSEQYHATAYAAAPPRWMQHQERVVLSEESPETVQSWLMYPLTAPPFSLADIDGNLRDSASFRDRLVLLVFWHSNNAKSILQLRELQRQWSELNNGGIQVVALNLDLADDRARVRKSIAGEGFSFLILFATEEVAGIYNILYRYLFDRRRDLPIPTTFLIEPPSRIIKLYQGIVSPRDVVADVQSRPTSQPERVRRALPFPGILPEQKFERNDFTYGIALFQRGYMDQAAESFKAVIATQPTSSEAYYNLGTLCLRTNKLSEARDYLEQAIRLQPEYAEAWNNLGTIAAEQGRWDEAVGNFEHSLSLKPGYAVALVNLGNLYRHRGDYEKAGNFLTRALEIEPNDPEANYSAGMLYAHQSDFERASRYLRAAVSLRPDYAEALNNLGVLLVQEKQYSQAEDTFRTCIRVAPSFEDAYINLARVYVLMKDAAQAKEVLEQLIRLQPSNKVAQQALEMLR